MSRWGLAGLFGLVACDPKGASIAIDCSMAFGEIETITLDTAGVDVTRTFGDLQMNATLFDDEYEGRSFDIGFFTEDGVVGTHALYQLDSKRLPANEFQGDHGFTGLHSVNDPASNDAVQWTCFARDPGAPVHRWEE